MEEKVGVPKIIILAGVVLVLLVLASLIGAALAGDGAGDALPLETNPVASASPDSTATLEPVTPTSAPGSLEPSPTSTVPAPPPSACAQAWGIQPPGDLPAWLQTPGGPSGLYTQEPYFLLAGKLILYGIVDAGGCDDNGLTLSGTASTCGMEKALAQTIAWQNQFDEQIYSAAVTNQVPAQVLKRLFAQETQFWPSTELSPPAYGIGNVTSPGVEPLFTWYQDVYLAVCKDVFANGCSLPYHSLSLEDQQLLRGYLIRHYLHAYCPGCAYGMDIDKIKASIDYFAKLLVANCYQVGLILENQGFVSSSLDYKDAWRVTLANYTIGAGCVNKAVDDMDLSQAFTWESFTEALAPDCHVDIYVNRITEDQ